MFYVERRIEFNIFFVARARALSLDGVLRGSKQFVPAIRASAAWLANASVCSADMTRQHYALTRSLIVDAVYEKRYVVTDAGERLGPYDDCNSTAADATCLNATCNRGAHLVYGSHFVNGTLSELRTRARARQRSDARADLRASLLGRA